MKLGYSLKRHKYKLQLDWLAEVCNRDQSWFVFLLSTDHLYLDYKLNLIESGTCITTA